MEPHELLTSGIDRHASPGLRRAESQYAHLNGQQPGNPSALHLLSAAARQQRRFSEALELSRRAIAIAPQSGVLQFNHGECCRAVGELVDAIAAYRECLRLGNAKPEVYDALGQALSSQGSSGGAIEAFERSISIDTNFMPAYEHLAACLVRLKRFSDAEAVCRCGLRARPAHGSLHERLGVALTGRRKWGQAAVSFRRAIELGRARPSTFMGLAQALNQSGDPVGAADAARRALMLDQNHGRAHVELGAALEKLGELGPASAEFAAALLANPEDAGAHLNLGSVLLQGLNHAEAYSHFQRARELAPSSPAVHGTLLLTMNYPEFLDERAILEEHKDWAAAHARPAEMAPHVWSTSTTEQDRPLRVGYVSPDLREHPVPYFLEPILRGHDRRNVTPVVFSDTVRPDRTTRRLKEIGCPWHDITGLNDAELADLVRRSDIDILVDLAGHTANNRLLAFARRLAPVQVSYLGYPNTTGLPREIMHYRVTDEICDPPGCSDLLHTERLVRLPAPFICYQAPTDAPPVAPAPFQSAGFVTFGCFNGMMKVTVEMIARWSAILRRTPGSRLLLKNKSMGDETARAAVLAEFVKHNIGIERLTLLGPTRSTVDHLACYGQVDVALDTYAYNGTTTTCEALWMGVPVITLAGVAHRSRVGASLMSSVGLSDWVGRDAETYVELAAALAADRDRLGSLRRGLRSRMQQSPVMDSRAFVAKLEAAYRRMRCEGGATFA